jgi:hypothetical protein
LSGSLVTALILAAKSSSKVAIAAGSSAFAGSYGTKYPVHAVDHDLGDAAHRR